MKQWSGTPTILIIGAYGHIGKCLVELLKDEKIILLVGGRDLRKAGRICDHIRDNEAILTPVHFDYASVTLEQIKQLRPNIIIDASNTVTLSFLEVAQICGLLNIAFIDASSDAVRKLRSQMVPAGLTHFYIQCGMSQFLLTCINELLSKNSLQGRRTQANTIVSLSKGLMFGEVDLWGYLDFLERPERNGSLKTVAIWSARTYRYVHGRLLCLFSGELPCAEECKDLQIATFLEVPPLAVTLKNHFPQSKFLFEWILRLGGKRDFSELSIEIEDLGQTTSRFGVTFFGSDREFAFLPAISPAACALGLLKDEQISLQENHIHKSDFETYKPLLDHVGLRSEFHTLDPFYRKHGSPLEQVTGDLFKELDPLLQTMNGSVVKASGKVTVAREGRLWQWLFDRLFIKLPDTGLALPLKLDVSRNETGTEIRQIFNHDIVVKLQCVAGTNENEGLLEIRVGPFMFAMTVFPSYPILHSDRATACRNKVSFSLDHWYVYQNRLPKRLAPNIFLEQERLEDVLKFSLMIEQPLISFSLFYGGWLRPLDDER